jgi:hypothetical protein
MSRKIELKWGKKTYSEVIEGNIELAEMAPDEISDALNRAVGNFAFYGSLRADAKKMQSQMETDYDMWFAEEFSKVASNPDYKKLTTEKAKAQQVMLDNQPIYLEWQNKKRSIQLVIDKAYVLVQSFELMTRTLQSVLAFRRVEFSSANQNNAPGASGSGDFLEE